MQFYHLLVESKGKKVELPCSVDGRECVIHISRASLTGNCKEGKCYLQVCKGKETTTICCLEKGKTESVPLNLYFSVDDVQNGHFVQCQGHSEVNLVGYAQFIDEHDSYDDFSEASSIEELDDSLESPEIHHRAKDKVTGKVNKEVKGKQCKVNEDLEDAGDNDSENGDDHSNDEDSDTFEFDEEAFKHLMDNESIDSNDNVDLSDDDGLPMNYEEEDEEMDSEFENAISNLSKMGSQSKNKGVSHVSRNKSAKSRPNFGKQKNRK